MVKSRMAPEEPDLPLAPTPNVKTHKPYFDTLLYPCGCFASWRKTNIDERQGKYEIIWVIEEPCYEHNEKMNMWEERLRE